MTKKKRIQILQLSGLHIFYIINDIIARGAGNILNILTTYGSIDMFHRKRTVGCPAFEHAAKRGRSDVE